MKKVLISISFLVLSSSSFATKKQDLKLEIDFFPKQMAWSIDKKDLGVVITQKMIFQGNTNERKIKVTPLEYLYSNKGTVRPKDMLTSSEKNNRSLLPYILENSEIVIPKNKKVEYNFRVQTNKEMSGCYFFGYYPKISNDNKNPEKKDQPIEGIKSAINMNLTMVSGGYLHIKGTEVFEIKDSILVESAKKSQKITYNFDFYGNCLLRNIRFKVDILQGTKTIFTQNKVQAEISDRSFLPGMSSKFSLNTKLPKGDYKIRVLMYSEDQDFKDFFHIKEENFKI